MKSFQLSFKNDHWSGPFPESFDSVDTLLFLYFSPSLHAHKVWKELKSQFPLSLFMGCSGAGEIKQTEICDDQIILTGMKFENTKIKISTVTELNSKNSEQAGVELAKQFSKEGLAGVFLLSDGLVVNGTSMIKGLKNILGPDLNLSGGFAGDGPNFKNTYVLLDGMPTENVASAVGFYGSDITIVSSADGGWIPFGPVRSITKADANVLFELDERPALELYKQFLGEQAKKLPSSALLFPIFLKSGEDKIERNAVRTILSVDDVNQSMTFAGDVPKGTSIQLMRAGHENLFEAATNVSQMTSAKIDHSLHTLSIVVSCVGRRLILGENTEGEVEKVFEYLPKGTVQTGFYSYGEIAPGHSGYCDLHNQTIAITLIQEKTKK
jgi:hypothetical protein